MADKSKETVITLTVTTGDTQRHVALDVVFELLTKVCAGRSVSGRAAVVLCTDGTMRLYHDGGETIDLTPERKTATRPDFY